MRPSAEPQAVHQLRSRSDVQSIQVPVTKEAVCLDHRARKGLSPTVLAKLHRCAKTPTISGARHGVVTVVARVIFSNELPQTRHGSWGRQEAAAPSAGLFGSSGIDLHPDPFRDPRQDRQTSPHRADCSIPHSRRFPVPAHDGQNLPNPAHSAGPARASSVLSWRSVDCSTRPAPPTSS